MRKGNRKAAVVLRRWPLGGIGQFDVERLEDRRANEKRGDARQHFANAAATADAKWNEVIGLAELALVFGEKVLRVKVEGLLPQSVVEDMMIACMLVARWKRGSARTSARSSNTLAVTYS